MSICSSMRVLIVLGVQVTKELYRLPLLWIAPERRCLLQKRMCTREMIAKTQHASLFVDLDVENTKLEKYIEGFNYVYQYYDKSIAHERNFGRLSHVREPFPFLSTSHLQDIGARLIIRLCSDLCRTDENHSRLSDDQRRHTCGSGIANGHTVSISLPQTMAQPFDSPDCFTFEIIRSQFSPQSNPFGCKSTLMRDCLLMSFHYRTSHICI
jgi:hypothetical protein